MERAHNRQFIRPLGVHVDSPWPLQRPALVLVEVDKGMQDQVLIRDFLFFRAWSTWVAMLCRQWWCRFVPLVRLGLWPSSFGYCSLYYGRMVLIRIYWKLPLLSFFLRRRPLIEINAMLIRQTAVGWLLRVKTSNRGPPFTNRASDRSSYQILQHWARLHPWLLVVAKW